MKILKEIEERKGERGGVGGVVYSAEEARYREKDSVQEIKKDKSENRK